MSRNVCWGLLLIGSFCLHGSLFGTTDERTKKIHDEIEKIRVMTLQAEKNIENAVEAEMENIKRALHKVRTAVGIKMTEVTAVKRFEFASMGMAQLEEAKETYKDDPEKLQEIRRAMSGLKKTKMKAEAKASMLTEEELSQQMDELQDEIEMAKQDGDEAKLKGLRAKMKELEHQEYLLLNRGVKPKTPAPKTRPAGIGPPRPINR